MGLIRDILHPMETYDRRQQAASGVLMSGGVTPDAEILGKPSDHLANALSLDLMAGTSRAAEKLFPGPLKLPAKLVGGAIGLFADLTVDPIVELGTAAVRGALAGTKRP